MTAAAACLILTDAEDGLAPPHIVQTKEAA